MSDPHGMYHDRVHRHWVSGHYTPVLRRVMKDGRDGRVPCRNEFSTLLTLPTGVPWIAHEALVVGRTAPLSWSSLVSGPSVMGVEMESPAQQLAVELDEWYRGSTVSQPHILE